LEIRVGYELIYDCPQPTPMMLVLQIHYSRASDIIVPDHVTTTPSLPLSAYRNGFGNWCTRLVAPAGGLTIASAALVREGTGRRPPRRRERRRVVRPLSGPHLRQRISTAKFCRTSRIALKGRPACLKRREL